MIDSGLPISPSETVIDESLDHRLTCPICSIELDHLDLIQAERHVNLCLDRETPSRLPSTDHHHPPSTIRDFPPSSSILSNQFPSTSNTTHHSKPLKPSNRTKLSTQALDRPQPKQPSGGRSSKNPPVPFYKLIPGTTFSVDSFNYGKIDHITAYFLSHAHSDHYTRLSSTWKNGKIYCSKTTANLIKLKLRVDPNWIVPLDLDRTYTIEGVQVTLVDANHCPGSAMFVFEGLTDPGRKPFRYLHCGDFRASPKQLNHPAIKDKVIDICYLDTTYLDPKYCFPAQEEVISRCCRAVKSKINSRIQVKGDGPSPSTESRLMAKHARHRRDRDSLVKSREMFKNWLSSNKKTSDDHPTSSRLSFDVKLEQDEIELKETASEPIHELEPLGKSHGRLESSLLHRPPSPMDQLGQRPLHTTLNPKVVSIKSDRDNDHEIQMKCEETSAEKEHFNTKTSDTLIVIGTYSIGKERLAIELAKQLGSKIYGDSRKMSILRSIEEGGDFQLLKDELLSLDPFEANIHLINMFAINPNFLKSYLNRFKGRFSSVIGIKPTGWSFKPSSSSSQKKSPQTLVNQSNLLDFIQTFDSRSSSSSALDRNQPKVEDDDDHLFIFPDHRNRRRTINDHDGHLDLTDVECFGVPYSEHSSFYELSCFCISMNWLKIIPTVNCGNPASRERMNTWIERWKIERNRLLSNPDHLNHPQADRGRSKVEGTGGRSLGGSLNPIDLQAHRSLLIQPRGLNYW